MSDDKAIPEREARRLLNDAMRRRLARCQEDIDEVLERHNCQLVCKLYIQDGRIIGDVAITDRPHIT